MLYKCATLLDISIRPVVATAAAGFAFARSYVAPHISMYIYIYIYTCIYIYIYIYI